MPENKGINTKMLNTTALAYMGDSVYEVYIRRAAIEAGNVSVDKLHRFSVKLVRAENQAALIKKLLEEGLLSEEEEAVARRAKNHRLAASKRTSRNDPMTDKLSTALEALVGYLYLEGREERLKEIVNMALEEGQRQAGNR